MKVFSCSSFYDAFVLFLTICHKSCQFKDSFQINMKFENATKSEDVLKLTRTLVGKLKQQPDSEKRRKSVKSLTQLLFFSLHFRFILQLLRPNPRRSHSSIQCCHTNPSISHSGLPGSEAAYF